MQQMTYQIRIILKRLGSALVVYRFTPLYRWKINPPTKWLQTGSPPFLVSNESCPLCNSTSGQPEDITHFISICSYFNPEREIMHDLIYQKG